MISSYLLFIFLFCHFYHPFSTPFCYFTFVHIFVTLSTDHSQSSPPYRLVFVFLGGNQEEIYFKKWVGMRDSCQCQWLLIQYRLNECTNATESQLVHTTSEKKRPPLRIYKRKRNKEIIYLYWLHCKLKVIVFFRQLVWGWDGKDSKHWRESYFSQPPPCWDVHETARNITNLQGRQSAPRRTTHCAIESEFVHDKAKEGHKATNSNLSQAKKRIFTLQWPLIPVFLYIPLPNLPERHRTIWWFRCQQFLIWT